MDSTHQDALPTESTSFTAKADIIYSQLKALKYFHRRKMRRGKDSCSWRHFRLLYASVVRWNGLFECASVPANAYVPDTKCDFFHVIGFWWRLFLLMSMCLWFLSCHGILIFSCLGCNFLVFWVGVCCACEELLGMKSSASVCFCVGVCSRGELCNFHGNCAVQVLGAGKALERDVVPIHAPTIGWVIDINLPWNCALLGKERFAWERVILV